MSFWFYHNMQIYRVFIILCHSAVINLSPKLASKFVCVKVAVLIEAVVKSLFYCGFVIFVYIHALYVVIIALDIHNSFTNFFFRTVLHLTLIIRLEYRSLISLLPLIENEI